MGAGLFWGIVLIIIGLSIIFRLFFDVNVVRVVVAAVFVLIGIKILLGRPVRQPEPDSAENNTLFSERVYHTDPQDRAEYNTIFGKTVYDYRHVTTLEDLRTRMSFNTVFGTTDILLPPNIPVRVKTDAVFSAAMMPNGNTVAFGSANYTSNDVRSDSLLLEIDAHVVFGSLNIKH